MVYVGLSRSIKKFHVPGAKLVWVKLGGFTYGVRGSLNFHVFVWI